MKITPRLAVTLTFIAFGMMVGSQIGAFPILRAQSSVDSFAFGILAGLATAANVLALSLGGFINRRFDHRSVLLFILPVGFAAMMTSLTSHSIWAFGLTFMLFNFALGITDLFMNAEASIVEHDAGKPIFSSFHAAVLYAMGLSALVSGYIAVKFGAIWATPVAVPFVAAAIWAVSKAIPHRIHEANEVKPTIVLPRKILILLGIIIGLDVAAELTCVQWSGQLLSDMQPTLAQYSGLGLAFYGLCNGTVRLFGDQLRKRFSDMTLVAASFVVGTIGFGILATGPGFAISVCAFALAGFGLALIFPCLFSVTAHLVPQARAAALAYASAISGPPRIFLPMVLGVLAQTYGLNAIYVAAGLACVLALAFTYWAAREIARQKGVLVYQHPSHS